MAANSSSDDSTGGAGDAAADGDDSFPSKGRVTVDGAESSTPPQDILVIDDEEAYRQLIGAILSARGYRIHLAENCQQAHEFLQSRTELPPLVITDWNMPDGEGIDLVRRIKRDPRWRYLPVIMCTGRTQPEEIQRGIDAGAFFYITKPIDGRVLTTAVAAAVRSYEPILRHIAEEVHDVSEVLPHIQELSLEFRMVEEAMNIARWTSRFFPDPEGARLGIQELLYNAIEHGNLGISYEEKSRMLENAAGFHNEILRRLELDEFRSKQVKLSIRSRPDFVECLIEDAGVGFDFRQFLKLTPDRALDMHGKGIAIANNIVFDELEYIEPGNKVRARIYRENASRSGDSATLVGDEATAV
ncbi:MAG: response regulator [bacterium]|nr:response regulator [bacterium]